MGSKENFALVEELAEVMGGVVGATRPAIEEGWVSRAHQVGQSGKIVAPKLQGRDDIFTLAVSIFIIII